MPFKNYKVWNIWAKLQIKENGLSSSKPGSPGRPWTQSQVRPQAWPGARPRPRPGPGSWAWHWVRHQVRPWVQAPGVDPVLSRTPALEPDQT